MVNLARQEIQATRVRRVGRATQDKTDHRAKSVTQVFSEILADQVNVANQDLQQFQLGVPPDHLGHTVRPVQMVQLETLASESSFLPKKVAKEYQDIKADGVSQDLKADNKSALQSSPEIQDCKDLQVAASNNHVLCNRYDHVPAGNVLVHSQTTIVSVVAKRLDTRLLLVDRGAFDPANSNTEASERQ